MSNGNNKGTEVVVYNNATPVTQGKSPAGGANEKRRRPGKQGKQPKVPGRQEREKRTEVFSVSAKRAAKAMKAWLHLLAKPLTAPKAFCPVNYNIVDSPMVMAFTTTCQPVCEVPAGKAREIIFFPGHCSESQKEQMDAEAYHQPPIAINGAELWHVGPVRTNLAGNVTKPFCVAMSPAAGNNVTGVDLPLTTSSTYVPVPWTNASAMLASPKSGHMRWKCIAMGISWRNTTEGLYKGGSVRTVQPPVEYQPDQVSDIGWMTYDRFRSFRLNEGLDGRLAWIPRKEDLAFWHTKINELSNEHTDATSSAGVRIFIEGGTTTAQKYEFDVVYHWALAGSSIADSCTQATTSTSFTPYVGDTLNKLANGPADATEAPTILSDIADAAVNGARYLAKSAIDLGVHAVSSHMRYHAVAPEYHRRVEYSSPGFGSQP